MTIDYTIVIDLARPLKTNTIEIHKGDNNSRRLRIVLMNDGKKLSMYEKDADGNVTSRYTSAVIKGVKPDKTVLMGDGEFTTDADGNMVNEITYTLPEDAASATGISTYTLTLGSSTGTSLTTPEFCVKVMNQLYTEDDYISDDQFKGFQDIYNKTMTALKQMQQYYENGIKNPKALSIVMGDKTYTYDGSEAVLVNFADGNNIAY